MLPLLQTLQRVFADHQLSFVESSDTPGVDLVETEPDDASGSQRQRRGGMKGIKHVGRSAAIKLHGESGSTVATPRTVAAIRTPTGNVAAIRIGYSGACAVHSTA